MTSVLVIGGTRFIGPEVVRSLLRDGAEVTVLHRGEHEVDLGGVRHLHADRSEIGDLLPQVAPDVILDMAPIHADHATTVMHAAEDSGVSRVVAVSSMDVYRGFDVVHGRDSELQPVPWAEDAEVRRRRYPYRDMVPRDSPMYRYDKLDVEEQVMAPGSVDGVVLRLPVVFGPEDGQHRLYGLVRRMADGMPVIVMADTVGRWRFMKSYRSNVADAIALGCLHPDAAGNVYNVGTFEGTEADWAAVVGSAMGWGGDVVMVPFDDTPASLRPEGDLRQDLVADTSRIRRELGWTERVGVEEAIAVTAGWELDHPPDEFAYDRDEEIAAAGHGSDRPPHYR